jgi:hypothetical protein
MRNTFRHLMPGAALIALAGQLLAGGFFLQLGNPEANPEALKANAVLVIKATGCHDPATARLTATAIGTVDGKRQSIPLQVTKLSEVGTFALTQQWPREGKWVIELVAKNPEQFTTALVVAGPQGIDRLHAKYNMKAFSPSDVEAMLQ